MSIKRYFSDLETKKYHSVALNKKIVFYERPRIDSQISD